MSRGDSAGSASRTPATSPRRCQALAPAAIAEAAWRLPRQPSRRRPRIAARHRRSADARTPRGLCAGPAAAGRPVIGTVGPAGDRRRPRAARPSGRRPGSAAGVGRRLGRGRRIGAVGPGRRSRGRSRWRGVRRRSSAVAPCGPGRSGQGRPAPGVRAQIADHRVGHRDQRYRDHRAADARRSAAGRAPRAPRPAGGPAPPGRG